MNAQSFVAKPVVIHAVQWAGHLADLPEAWREKDMFSVEDDKTLIVRTLDGLAVADLGDYVICGTVGEFYPVKRLIFEAKYEVAA